MTIELFCGDCLTELGAVPDESINLAFVDPPYNIGIFCKMPPAEYLAWCEQWIALVSRKLAPNGAFWVSHKNPRILGQLADMIAAHGRGLVNWITWDKYNGNKTVQVTGGPMMGLTMSGCLRSFYPLVEYLIYHADEGQWTAQCDKERGFIFEPILQWFLACWERSGLTRRQIDEACHTANVTQYWFLRRNYQIPTLDRYTVLQRLAPDAFCRDYEDLRRDYEDLRRDYEDLRRDYEDLRYTFNNPGGVSSVWQIAPAKRNGHATPKPEALLEHIILATSNPGDVVLDPMFGGGTTGAVAVKYGRSFVGCEIDPRYVEMARQRIEQPTQAEMVL